jgi:hypothetical protein
VKRIIGQRFNAQAKSPPTQKILMPLTRFANALTRSFSLTNTNLEGPWLRESNPIEAQLAAKTEGHSEPQCQNKVIPPNTLGPHKDPWLRESNPIKAHIAAKVEGHYEQQGTTWLKANKIQQSRNEAWIRLHGDQATL